MVEKNLVTEIGEPLPMSDSDEECDINIGCQPP